MFQRHKPGGVKLNGWAASRTANELKQLTLITIVLMLNVNE